MIEMTYLLNSGFLVRVGRTLLVFDDFKDPAGAVDAAAAAADFDHLYFFASHSHFDHFDAHIQRYEAQADRYILSDDIRCMKDCSAFNPQKLTFLKPYANWQDDVLAVESFDSTDLGTSFCVTLKEEGTTIFHAGDFNWWDWTGEPAEQRKLAENAFRKQMKKLGMLIVQDQVWGRVTANRSSGKSTRYYMDEMHLLLKEEQTAAYSVEIWKRFRKWGGIPTGLTQNVKDLLSSREVENIFENSDMIIMLNQAAGDRQILAKQLNISPHQLSYVTHSGEGEGLLFFGNVILPFVDRFPTDLELYRIMTTKLGEVSEGAQK